MKKVIFIVIFSVLAACENPSNQKDYTIEDSLGVTKVIIFGNSNSVIIESSSDSSTIFINQNQ